MQYSFLHVFANDRTIDQHELAMLEKLALSDSEVDDDERASVSRLCALSETTSPGGLAEVCRFKTRYQIPEPLTAQPTAIGSNFHPRNRRARSEQECRRPACAETVARP